MTGPVRAIAGNPIVSLAVLCALVIAVSILLTRSSRNAAPHASYDSGENSYRNAGFQVALIPASDSTYGYDILMDGRILIHQPHIPALPGNRGFASEEDARRVAEFVVRRMRKNVFPPSVTRDEVDSLLAVKKSR